MAATEHERVTLPLPLGEGRGEGLGPSASIARSHPQPLSRWERGVGGLLLCLLLIGCSTDTTPTTQRVTLRDRTFTLELALDDATRYKGLSGREAIAEDGGMLFVFPHARVLQFVMRDCPAPIDVIFLGPNGRIVALHAMRPEPGVAEADLARYSSKWDAQFAIEVKGGTIAQLGLEPGEAVALPLERLKRLAR